MLCSQKTAIYIDFGERHQAKAYNVHGARANKLLTSYLTSTVVGKKVSNLERAKCLINHLMSGKMTTSLVLYRRLALL